jgi:hypothetical protein
MAIVQKRSRWPGIIAFIAIFAVGATVVYVIRAPIRYAARIKVGDSPARVHELLGEPDEVFETTTELQESDLEPMSYVFTNRAGRGDIPVDELPPIVTRAEWFEYGGTAGHLVYYDGDRVTDVLWGGT